MFLLVYDLSLKRKNVIVSIRYALNSARFYFTMYFTSGPHRFGQSLNQQPY